MSEFEYWWLTYFIGVEFFIVLAFIIICYFTVFYFIQKKSRVKKQISYLEESILKNNSVPESFVRKIDVLLKVFKNLDQKDPPDWKKNRISIMRAQILPHARPYIKSKKWTKHYLLVLCYDYCIEIEDHELLIKLIKDPCAIVSLNAMRIASIIGKKELLKAILVQLQQEPQLFRIIAIEEFFHSAKWSEVIIEELTSSSDPQFKRICYEILNNVGADPQYFEFVKTDCYSPIIDLRLAAIRALPYLDKNKYLEVYNDLINDKNWLVRNAIVKLLGELKDPASLDLLAGTLNDSSWWVRINTTKSLAYFGDSGRLLLTEYKNLSNIEAHGEAAYFLKIQQLRTNLNYD